MSYPRPCPHCGAVVANVGVYIVHRPLARGIGPRMGFECIPEVEFKRRGLGLEWFNGAWHFKRSAHARQDRARHRR